MEHPLPDEQPEFFMDCPNLMNSLKGHLLVASPSLEAPFFSRTVILMCEHSAEGAMGLVLNRSTEATIRDVAEQVLNEPLDWEKPIHIGGPVTGPLVVLHGDSDLADQHVFGEVYSSIEANKVQELLRQQPEPSMVVANYAGWGPGQLEREMVEESWLVLPATAKLVFIDEEMGDDEMWSLVMQYIRSADLRRITGLKNLPLDPSFN